MPYKYYSRRSRSRLRKRVRTDFIRYSIYNLRVRHSSSSNNNKIYWDRVEGPTWTALNKCWLGYVIARNKELDEDNMRLYAKRIQKLERELEIEVSEFRELGLYAFYQGDLTDDNEEEDEKEGDDVTIQL